MVELLILGFIWLVVFASPLFVWNGQSSLNWEVILPTWVKLMPFLGLSLVNQFILLPLLFFRKRNRYFVFAGVILIAFSFAIPFLPNQRGPFDRESGGPKFDQGQPPDKPDREQPDEFSIPPEPRMKQGPTPPMNLPPFLNTFLVAMLILGSGTGMRLIFRGSELEQERESLEKEKVKSELAFLRNQVSPHFFMNTLNNIHSLIDLDTEEAKGALIRLSKLMQHLLYDSQMETLPVKEEIAFIRSYTGLMKLRFTEKVKVNLHTWAEDPEVRIPPLLFTSLLENAFKYGVSYREKSFIDISLTAGDGKLVFKVSNSIIEKRKPLRTDENSGIGLENTRKRLDLLYGKKYKMDVSDENGVFDVTLTIPL